MTEEEEDKSSSIILNISGKKFTVSKATLTSISNTYFTTLLDDKVKILPLIDRDNTHFEYILNYLRNRELVILPDNELELKKIQLEAQYYCLMGLFKLIEQKLDNYFGICIFCNVKLHIATY